MGTLPPRSSSGWRDTASRFSGPIGMVRSPFPRTGMANGSEVITIERFIMEQERLYPEATGELSNLLYDLCLAAKIISRHVRRAGLSDILGAAGAVNVSGDLQQKLDLFANETVRNSVQHTGRVCVTASEEDPEPVPVPPGKAAGKYVVLYDPLDGSMNIDVNVSIGTIFSIHKRVTKKNGTAGLADFHRNLISGGIFLCPAATNYPHGKLRLLYEAAPLALVVEQAGGRATDGCRPILDIVPQSLHQKTPLVIGSKDDVGFAARILSTEAVVGAK